MTTKHRIFTKMLLGPCNSGMSIVPIRHGLPGQSMKVLFLSLASGIIYFGSSFDSNYWPWSNLVIIAELSMIPRMSCITGLGGPSHCVPFVLLVDCRYYHSVALRRAWCRNVYWCLWSLGYESSWLSYFLTNFRIECKKRLKTQQN